MKLAHTTKSGLAKCLAYRNRKRCGRKAVAVVNYRKANGEAGHQTRCKECSNNSDVTFRTVCNKGFAVRVDPLDSWQTRQYIPVGEAYAEDTGLQSIE